VIGSVRPIFFQDNRSTGTSGAGRPVFPYREVRENRNFLRFAGFRESGENRDRRD